MITLQELTLICNPDNIATNTRIIRVSDIGISSYLLDAPVKNIEGDDDGLTITICDAYLEDQIKQAICEVYSYSGVGSGLHIVLDDENVQERHIRWCVDEIIPKIDNLAEREACQRCAQLLLLVSAKERRRIIQGYGREWGL